MKHRLEQETVRPRVTAGERTRRAILSMAVDIASAEGLEGLSIGNLAGKLGMSKSGLFAHFGSKEELQLATVDAAREIFVREIVQDAFQEPVGVQRLVKMMDRWISYVERKIFRGGCFFAAVSAEFDGRPGRVRDLIVELTKAWLDAMEEQIVVAQTMGQFRSEINAKQLAFELHALVQEANWANQLLQDPGAFERARQGIYARITASITRKAFAKLRSLIAGGKKTNIAKKVIKRKRK